MTLSVQPTETYAALTMTSPESSRLSALPSVDRLLQSERIGELIFRHGRQATVRAVRAVLLEIRSEPENGGEPVPDHEAILDRVTRHLTSLSAPSLRPVFNLTGTVLHTNLGRAALAQEAIDAVQKAASSAVNLEYRVAEGQRGDRDEHVETQLCQLTGAEAATVVNNNAAALMLVLNSLALDRSVPVSRGELIEIGGSFRLPDIMTRSGCRLVEVGTTNRTHLQDYGEAIAPDTGLIMKVHTSNYVIEGFTAAVAERDLAALCRAKDIPFVVDLGSGALLDFGRLGLPHEPTPAEALRRGADLVTFSGDKLLGGPQAGLIVGRKDLIQRLNRNPMKRALRCDKMILAGLSATLQLYADPDRAAGRIPALRAPDPPVFRNPERCRSDPAEGSGGSGRPGRCHNYGLREPGRIRSVADPDNSECRSGNIG